jgi:hypothetical protein
VNRRRRLCLVRHDTHAPNSPVTTTCCELIRVSTTSTDSARKQYRVRARETRKLRDLHVVTPRECRSRACARASLVTARGQQRMNSCVNAPDSTRKRKASANARHIVCICLNGGDNRSNCGETRENWRIIAANIGLLATLRSACLVFLRPIEPLGVRPKGADEPSDPIETTGVLLPSTGERASTWALGTSAPHGRDPSARP